MDDERIRALLEGEVEAARLEAEADDLDDRGNPARALVLRDQAAALRARAYRLGAA